MSWSEATLPPTLRHDLGGCFPISFRLAHFVALATLHPEGLSGVLLDFIFFLCGVILSTAFWQWPIAFIAHDALALLVSRVQVTNAARAPMARGLGPNNAELTARFVRSRRIVRASLLTRSAINPMWSRTPDGLSHHGMPIIGLPLKPLRPPLMGDRTRAVLSL